MDQEAIKDAEMRVAKMQSVLDGAQRALQAAERAQQTAEKSVEVMRTVAIAAVGGLVLVALIHSVRREQH